MAKYPIISYLRNARIVYFVISSAPSISIPLPSPPSRSFVRSFIRLRIIAERVFYIYSHVIIYYVLCLLTYLLTS